MSQPFHFDLAAPFLSQETSEGSLIKRSVLTSGLRVLTEQVPGAKSVSLGYWVAVGSRDESAVGEGSTHFLEHLLFKSTKTRTPLQISSAFDAIGADNNAATAHEYTCYYAHLRGDDLPIAVTVLSDMLTSALLKPAEFETERQVIIEELAMSDDDPTDAAATRLMTAVLGDHPIGKPIGGTVETIEKVDRDSVWNHYQEFYRPEELVIVAAGDVNHDELIAQLEHELAAGGWDMRAESTPVERRSLLPIQTKMTAPVSLVDRPIEQVNLMIGMPAINIVDERRFALGLFASALGGGMSSRLFQEVREKHGLAYSVYAYNQSFSDVGIFGAYAGTTTKNASQVLELIMEQFALAHDGGITAEELALVQGQQVGGLALRSESMSWRMNRLAGAELRSGNFYDYDYSIGRIQKVTLDDIASVSSEILSRPIAVSAVGNLDSKLADQIHETAKA